MGSATTGCEDHAYAIYAAQFLVRQFLETFLEFPPRMKPASFGIDQALAKMEQALNIDLQMG